MRNRQIEKSSADAAMRWNRYLRPGDEPPLAMLWRCHRRPSVQEWLRVREGNAA
jgi:hypothetical protein